MFRKIFREAAQRPLLAVVIGLAAGLLSSAMSLEAFAELADEVGEGDSHRFDRTVLLWIGSSFPAWLDAPMPLITGLGYYRVVIPLLLISSYLLYRKNLKFSAALLAVSTAGGIVLTTVLKAVFQRTRPELFETGYMASFYSFPSGHATVAVGFYGTLTMLVAWRLEGRPRWVVAAAGISLILLIGFSRLYLGVHYPTDILAGYLAASLWVGAVATALLFWRSIRKIRSGELSLKDIRNKRPVSWE